METLPAAALALAALTAAVSAASLLGAISHSLDAATHLAPLTALAALVALALALATGQMGAAALAAAALAGAAILVLPEFTGRARGPPGKDPVSTLKIIQFNLWWKNRDPEKTVAWLRQEDADILVLEEAIGAGGRVADALADLYPHRAPARDGPRASTVILAKTPMAELGVFDTVRPRRPHAQTFARLAGFSVVGVHVGWPIPPGIQAAQLARLEAALAGFNRDSLILAGDFNSTPWSFALKGLDRRLGLIRRTRALSTWPAGASAYLPPLPFPLFPIDHLYAGPAWTTVRISRGPRLGSDHHPVIAVLAKRSA